MMMQIMTYLTGGLRWQPSDSHGPFSWLQLKFTCSLEATECHLPLSTVGINGTFPGLCSQGGLPAAQLSQVSQPQHTAVALKWLTQVVWRCHWEHGLQLPAPQALRAHAGSKKLPSDPP